jgi:hypothetical protein
LCVETSGVVAVLGRTPEDGLADVPVAGAEAAFAVADGVTDDGAVGAGVGCGVGVAGDCGVDVAATAVGVAAVRVGDGLAAAAADRDGEDAGVMTDVLSVGATVATLVLLGPTADPRSATASTSSVAARATSPSFAKRTRRRTPAAEGPPM